MDATFQSNKKKALFNTAWVAGFAAIVAVGYMYFGAGVRNIIALAAIGVGAIALAYGVYWLRGFVGGTRAVSFSEEQIIINRKKGPVRLSWADVKEAKFETINTTPWLTFYEHSKKKYRIALEDFDESDRKAITNLVMNTIPGKTTSTRDWILLNRVPTSLIEKGIKVLKD
jgi:hypothetical protein